MSLRCLIVDDNPLAVDLLTAYVAKLPDLIVAGATTDPLEGLRLLRSGNPGLVFLDIQMPGLNGLEFMHAAGESCRFILVTAYSEYAFDGFEHGVVDYLLKPVGFDRFCKAVNRAIAQLRPAISPSEPNREAPHLFIRTDQRLQKVLLRDILYIESQQNYIVVYLTDGKLMSLQPLKRIAAELPPVLFMQIHRSYIVNTAQVTAIERNRLFVGQTELPIGDLYRQHLLDRLNKGK